MRLTKLNLENYGGFHSRQIVIPQGAGLTVIFGANEAGKSTCLEGIGDFLFSIPRNTQRGSLFGYDSMRIEASMAMADGRVMTLKRRKGNGNTIADPSGTAFSDSVLTPILGAITRDRFENLFGLNHETLRNGGEQLLHADGDIGRLIVEAGGGLRALVSRLEDIDGEAGELFDTRRSTKRVFYQQLTAFEAAEKTARSAQLTRESYEQTRKASITAGEKLEALRSERRNLGTASARLERVLRVVPHLRQLDTLTEALQDYGDVAAFPQDFAPKLRTVLATLHDAERRLIDAVARKDRLKARLDALVVDATLKASEQNVRDIAERAIHVSKARADRTNRQREIDEGEAQLATLRQILGLPGNAELASLIPEQSALDLVRRLADEMVERRPQIEGTKKRLHELADERTTIDHRLNAARAAGYHNPPEAPSSLFVSLAAQKSAQHVRRGRLDADHATLNDQLVSLGVETIERLAALPCPSPDDIRSEIVARDALSTQIDEQIRLKRQAGHDIAVGEAAIHDLQASGPIANDASLADARALRSEYWMPIKSAYITGNVEEDAATRLTSADRLDAAILSSDALADRRAAEAERAASLAHTLRHVSERRASIDLYDAEIAALSSQLETRKSAWARNFQEANAKHGELAPLLQFALTRQQVLDASQKLNADRHALSIDEAQLAPIVEQLERIEQNRKLDPSLSFSVRVSAVQNSITHHEQAHADYKRDVRDHEDISRKHRLANTELLQLASAQQTWDATWPDATRALGLKQEITPANAISAVTEWVGARGILSAIGQARHRLQRMDEDETSLTMDTVKLATELAINIGEDSVVAAQMLLTRLEANLTAQTQYDGLRPDYKEAKVITDQAQTVLATSQNELTQLANSVKLDGNDHDALLEAASRCEARSNLCDQIASTQTIAKDVGDELDLAALREEWDNRDLDEIRAELNEQISRVSNIESEIEEAILAQKSAQDDLDAYMGQSEVNLAVAEREAATAQMHLALERYLELSIARELVTSAMATIRAEQQDPLIRRASDLFATTTLGEFIGIETDMDDKGLPVVKGRRADGRSTSVATMSDGTRDQLFLAFRLASLENYADATEPLPFIADDILVHFDDERSRSTLNLLAEFGKRNQVLLFTHHRSVRALAEPLLENGVANIIDLDRVADF